jgi:hypothetical protein
MDAYRCAWWLLSPPTLVCLTVPAKPFDGSGPPGVRSARAPLDHVNELNVHYNRTS